MGVSVIIPTLNEESWLGSTLASLRGQQPHEIIVQTLRNWTLTVLAAGGVSPDRLAVFFPLVR
jgi:hypothetical protein